MTEAMRLTAAFLIATNWGDIMDSNCVKMGSHAVMEKEHGIADAKACTPGCVKNGAKFVLCDNATRMTWDLDDQTKPEAFAGEKVQVKGSLDAAANIIHVQSIRKM